MLAARCGGEILGEDFGADVTITLQFPVDLFQRFQKELADLSVGKLMPEVIESRETVVPI
jgi:hypothetical protein